MLKTWKRVMLAAGLLLACGLSSPAMAEDTIAGSANLANMGRGLVNIVTCFLEVPRCLVYRNSQVPLLGAVAGGCEGLGLTGMRAFAGVADFVSFGFMTDAIYRTDANFKEWVWESPWVPKY